MGGGRSVGVVLGSAFTSLPEVELVEVRVPTRAGEAVLHRVPGRDAYVLFRHGSPHRWLPHQIPYRAQALALAEVGVGALLVTSSCGVLQPRIPCFVPLMVRDLVWLDNRLPDGSACSVFDAPTPGQGHLVVTEGLFSADLGRGVRALAEAEGVEVPEREVVFWYAPGPRNKTAAENRVLASLGVDVNSMTLAPEVVLANELGIPCAAVVVGHKPSREGAGTLDEAAIAESLARAREAVARLAVAFLLRGEVVPFANRFYRFDGEPDAP